MTTQDFPRILLVTSSNFNRYSGGGITLTNLFWGWPPDRIAMAHSDAIAPDDRVCQRFYALGLAEMRKLWPFAEVQAVMQRARASQPAPPSVMPAPSLPHQQPTPPKPSKRLVRWLYRAVVGDGVPEKVRISPSLDAFVADFQPELIYTFLGGVPFMRLVRALADRYDVPFVVHMMDDWPSTIYRRGLFAPWLRRQVSPLLHDLLQRAALNMGICDAMSRDFEARYGVPFVSFHNAVDMTRWRAHRCTDYAAGKPFRLVYSGSIIAHAQLDSLRDMTIAVAGLHEAGVPVEMRIHSPAFYAEDYRADLEKPPAVQFAPPPEDDTIAPLFARADLLALPVNFDEASVRYIRYSMPTKIPAYLASGTPTLVYGPPGVAQVDYAAQDDWGYVVPQQGVSRVEQAIRLLMTDGALRARLGRRSAAVADSNHDAATVRRAFQAALRRAAHPQETSN